jgi:hypothetical protein
VPRGVTVGGAIVLGDSPAQSVGGASAVTPLAPHRFHGGDDLSPDRADTTKSWWIRSPEKKDADIADMMERFSDVTVIDDDQDLAYKVTYETGRGRYSVFILPQVDETLPSVFAIQPKTLGRRQGRNFKKAPHLYLSGALCIADRSDWAGKEYKTSVAAAWTAHWLACYTAWRMNGIWPSEGYAPNDF